jgi:hypothetical protein
MAIRPPNRFSPPWVGRAGARLVGKDCMVGVEAVAERMGDHFVGHHPTAQAGDATRRVEDSLRASMVTSLLCVCKVSSSLATAAS